MQKLLIAWDGGPTSLGFVLFMVALFLVVRRLLKGKRE